MKTYVIIYNNGIFFTDDEFDQGIEAMEWAEHYVYTVAPTIFTLDGKDHKWTYAITNDKNKFLEVAPILIEEEKDISAEIFCAEETLRNSMMIENENKYR